MSKITIFWTPSAKSSYFEELDFIALKWTPKEVNSFILMVNEYIENLSKGIFKGKKYTHENIHSVVISKQTTIFYREYPDKNFIALLLFWNNLKDPEILKRSLQSL